MKGLSRRTGAKVAAWLLLTLMLVLALGSGLGVAALVETGSYQDGGVYLRQRVLEDHCARAAQDVLWSYYPAVTNGWSEQVYWEGQFAPGNSNFYFTLTDGTGAVVLQNATTDDPQYTYTAAEQDITNVQYSIFEYYDTYADAEARLSELEETYALDSYAINPAGERFRVSWRDTDGTLQLLIFDSEEDMDQWMASTTEVQEVLDITSEASRYALSAICYDRELLTLTAQVPQRLTARDALYYKLQLLQLLVDWRGVLPVVLGLSAPLALGLTVFLCLGAGRKASDDTVCLHWYDRMPLELLLSLLLLSLLVLVACIPVAILSESYSFAAALVGLGLTIPAALGLVWGLVSLSARVKAGRWWQRSLCWWLCHTVAQGCRALIRWLGYVSRGLPLVWQLALGWLLLSLVELFFVLNRAGGTVWVLERLLLTPVLVTVGIQLTRLREGARRIADGDLSAQINLNYMRGELRRHGEDLNHITHGLQQAVDDRLRSERLKTELITNVSHDIKTPLTSIVNYVDLLSQEELPSETARGYLEVLQRQSARLRKLTEDLVEASKAATGNVETRPEPMDVNVLLTQTAGEFEETLHGLQLEPVLTLREPVAMINADGRLLWRVFDNLMNNICKYALPGTRVYLSAQRQGEQIEIVFRNISRYPLNVSSDELMERFVRGDASRSTEGSGLGLSIAKSLTELQGGSFDLTVDGDLFKATVRFPAL